MDQAVGAFGGRQQKFPNSPLRWQEPTISPTTQDRRSAHRAPTKKLLGKPPPQMLCGLKLAAQQNKLSRKNPLSPERYVQIAGRARLPGALDPRRPAQKNHATVPGRNNIAPSRHAHFSRDRILIRNTRRRTLRRIRMRSLPAEFRLLGLIRL